MFWGPKNVFSSPHQRESQGQQQRNKFILRPFLWELLGNNMGLSFLHLLVFISNDVRKNTPVFRSVFHQTTEWHAWCFVLLPYVVRGGFFGQPDQCIIFTACVLNHICCSNFLEGLGVLQGRRVLPKSTIVCQVSLLAALP